MAGKRVILIASLVVVMLLGMAFLLDATSMMGGGIIEADCYYLPLQNLIPDETQRRAVEDSIIKTSIESGAHQRKMWFFIHGMALAGALVVCGSLIFEKTEKSK